MVSYDVPASASSLSNVVTIRGTRGLSSTSESNCAAFFHLAFTTATSYNAAVNAQDNISVTTRNSARAIGNITAPFVPVKFINDSVHDTVTLEDCEAATTSAPTGSNAAGFNAGRARKLLTAEELALRRWTQTNAVYYLCFINVYYTWINNTFGGRPHADVSNFINNLSAAIGVIAAARQNNQPVSYVSLARALIIAYLGQGGYFGGPVRSFSHQAADGIPQFWLDIQPYSNPIDIVSDALVFVEEILDAQTTQDVVDFVLALP